MKQLHVRRGMAIAAVVACVLAIASPAGAYNTFNNHRLTYGVVGQKYWISSSASPHEYAIDTGWGNWNATSTPVSWSSTTTQSQSHMDFYKVTSVNTWWAITSMYIDTTEVDPNNTNWWWAKVRLDGDFANCPNRVGVMAHEDGHGMGLAHVSGGNPRLMRWDIASLSTTAPWPDDIAGINALY